LPGSLCVFQVLVIWPWAWPDGVVAGVIDRGRVDTHEVALGWLGVMGLYENRFSLAAARGGRLVGP